MGAIVPTKEKIIYRVYWKSMKGELDYLDTLSLFTAKMVFTLLYRCDIFNNAITYFGGIRIWKDKEWKEWTNKFGETYIMEIYRSYGYVKDTVS